MQQPIGTTFGATSTAADVLRGVDLTGRTAVVTGGSSGLGLETVRTLAAAGARVLAPARRGAATRETFADAPGVEVIDGLDLGDLAAVARTAEGIAERVRSVDLLIAAAGVMTTPQRPTGPGWDHQFAVNHLGHAAFVTRLYPLLAAAGARVVVYSSAAHHLSDIRWDDLHFRRGYDKWTAYGQSKTANALFALHLDTLGRDDGVRAVSLHPGAILTGLQRDLTAAEQMDLGWIDADGTVLPDDFKTPEQGAATGLWAATSADLDGRGGLYLQDCDVAPVAGPGASMEDGVAPHAVDPASAERLWDLTVDLTGCGVPR